MYLESLCKEVIYNKRRISIDSRTLEEGDIFFALKGKNYDGHNFLQEILSKKAFAAVVEKKIIIPELKIFEVPDSLIALIDIARYIRSHFYGMVIGITGSFGKTTTKEILSLMLSKFHPISKTEKNFNNHIGVPLALANFNLKSEFFVVEMGMSNKSELSNLSQVVKPHIVLINNVGHAHIGNFDSIQDLAKAKVEVVDGLLKDGIVILNRDSNCFHYIYDLINKNNNVKKIITFGKEESSIQLIKVCKDKIFIRNNLIEQNFEFFFSYCTQKVNIYNTLAAIAIIFALNLKVENYLAILQEFQNLPSRGREIRISYKNLLIVDYSYNSSLESCIENIQNFRDKKYSKGRKVLVIGDMLELGEKSEELHKQLALNIEKNKEVFDLLITVGMYSKIINNIVNIKNINFFNVDILIKSSKNLFKENDIIFIQGSRAIKLDKMINFLRNLKT